MITHISEGETALRHLMMSMTETLETVTAERDALKAQQPVAWLCCVPGQDQCLLFDEPSDERYPPGYKYPLFLAAGAQDRKEQP